MARRPLFLQLIFIFVPISLVGIAILAFFFNQTGTNFFYSETKKNLRDRAHILKSFIALSEDVSEFAEHINSDSHIIYNMRVTIIDTGGLVIADSHNSPALMDDHSNRPEIIDAEINGEGFSQRFSNTLQIEQMYLAIPVYNKNKKVYLRLSVSIKELNLTIKKAQKQVFLASIWIAIIILIASYLFSKTVTSPIQTIQIEAEKFVKTLTQAEPIPSPNIKELASLSFSFNKMAKEIDRRIKIIRKEKNDKDSILTSLQDGLVTLDNEYNITTINETAKDYLNILDPKPAGKKINTLIKKKRVLALIKKTRNKVEKQQAEITIKQKKKRYFIFNGTPLLKGTELSGVLILITDITFQKQLESVRSDFVANVSHELKTPITSILGYVEIIMGKDINPEQKEDFLSKVLNQTNRMNTIIDDLLKLSKIESQEDDNTIESFDNNLLAIIDGAREDLNQKATANRNNIVIDCYEKLMLNCDPHLIREAIGNLTENAIKYGEIEKDILIKVEKTEKIAIHVINYGDPIPEKYHKKIFQRFYRIDKSRDRNLGGTGLGLAIVKHIAFAHGGDVNVSRKMGKTIFSLILPNS
jgi:two-component system phosphate regulon sensor histidine kinase PhoR